ncbi:MAG: dTDP-4-dehydrorhamnose 3,5-epimerase [Elusimicrobia bacterium RIFOXYA2_FULL_58_8]|nr:MAG: dTDP-4-dehydrorhamnose 3,5-epimerase [Elusimicrobia bacterium RIFOXYA2_FULL_58_8]
MNFVKKYTAIAGCFEILAAPHCDARGRFVKVLHAPEFKKLGLDSDFCEAYYSVSKKGVLRGLHFQAPPAALSKLVFCADGQSFEAVLDLRKWSKTFGKAAVLELSSQKANMLYIPKGCAHGFCALSRQVIMVYKTSAVYSPEHDTGVLWNSAGIKWPVKKPLLSARDVAFSALKDFKTPFCRRHRGLNK